MKMYGIPNCTTVKKARAWLDAHGIAYAFHDYKKQGVPEAVLEQAQRAAGWAILLNRKGPTWRKLDAATQASVKDAASALAVMRASPSVIKRPILEHEGRFEIGFSEAAYAAICGR